jgi:hypothetical protein
MNDVTAQIASLENKVRKLKRLQTKRQKAQKTLEALDAQIATIAGPTGAVATKRTRISSDELRKRIVTELRRHPKTGLSQMEIATNTGLNYVSVAVFLKRNPKDFRSEGKHKQKRYFVR